MVLKSRSFIDFLFSTALTQSIDDAHKSAGEVVSNVEHGALLPGVDEAGAAHGEAEEGHGDWRMITTVSCPQ